MIISDATAIIVLININEFKLLKLFTSYIILTQEVYNEVCIDPTTKKAIDSHIQSNFISLQNYSNQILFEEIQLFLDEGESASIALAVETKYPLLIDEKKGRQLAKQLGVDIIGLVGIIRFLYLENKLNKNQVLDLIEKLKSTDFRISQTLLRQIIL